MCDNRECGDLMKIGRNRFRDPFRQPIVARLCRNVFKRDDEYRLGGTRAFLSYRRPANGRHHQAGDESTERTASNKI